MSRITFLGTGMIGSALAEAAARRGDVVTVWNRTISKAEGLKQFGIHVADDPATAVRGADRVHIALHDDAAVDAVLAQALPGLSPTTPIIDHTTVSPAGVLARKAWCDERHLRFLHAPLFMSPSVSREGGGIMICSGAQERYEEVRPALEKMTGTLWYLGERIDLAACYKLFGNIMILSVVAGLADVYELAASLGVAATEAHSLFSKLKITSTVDIRGAKMARGEFAPSWDLATARKDVRIMLGTVDDPAALAVLPGLATRMDHYLAKGAGQKDVAVLAMDAVARAPGSKDPQK